jgi:hypothetical protein
MSKNSENLKDDSNFAVDDADDSEESELGTPIIEEPFFKLDLTKQQPHDYVILIYGNHIDNVYVPELGKSYEAKVNHTTRDTILSIKRGLTNVKKLPNKRVCIRSVNSRTSSLLASAMFSLMSNNDTILADYTIECGLSLSKYNEPVLIFNLLED